MREVESWILADRQAISKFFGVGLSLIPIQTDEISNPKAFLFNLVRRCRRRGLKNAILPTDTASIGPRYNFEMINFIDNKWRIERATMSFVPSPVENLVDLLNTIRCRGTPLEFTCYQGTVAQGNGSGRILGPA